MRTRTLVEVVFFMWVVGTAGAAAASAYYSSIEIADITVVAAFFGALVLVALHDACE